MREVLAARSDRDFVRTARRPHSDPVMSGGRRLLRKGVQNPGLLVGGIAITAAATAVIMNALSFQVSRHPAPIFAKAERGSAPPQADYGSRLLAPTPPVRPAPAHSAAPLPPARDPIGEIIRGTEVTGSASIPGRLEEVGAESQRLVAFAQRALAKLGYGPLKVDGIYGQGTRQAVERFERDRRLPATGELGARTIRELSAQSGIRVE